MAESHYVARGVWGCFRNDVSPSVSLPNSSWLRSPNPDRRTGCQGPDGVTARQEASRAGAALTRGAHAVEPLLPRLRDLQGRRVPGPPPAPGAAVDVRQRAGRAQGPRRLGGEDAGPPPLPQGQHLLWGLRQPAVLQPVDGPLPLLLLPVSPPTPHVLRAALPGRRSRRAGH